MITRNANKFETPSYYKMAEFKVAISGAEKINVKPSNKKFSLIGNFDTLNTSFESIRKLILNIIIFTITIVFLLYTYREVYNTQTYIETISIPESVAKLGYSSEVAAQRLWSSVKNIQQDSTSHKQEKALVRSSDGGDINIPDTTLSLGKIVRYFKSVLNSRENTIAGEFICINADSKISEISLRLRVIGEDIKFITMPPIDKGSIESYFHEAALRIVEILDPYKAILYLQNRDSNRAQKIARMMADIGNDDQKWGLLFRVFGIYRGFSNLPHRA